MRKEDRRVFRRAVRLTSTSAILIATLGCVPAAAQAQRAAKARDTRPILIIGDRQSVARAAQPLATLDQDAISATGATTMGELLQRIKPLTQSADGSDPIFLLNGQRTSGYQEIGSLPPEALDKVEVLPEAAALRFGYPPTRRVLNFIMKRHFRQIEARGDVGTTTRPGSTSANAALNLTRLNKDQRLTVALERRHTSSLLQSRRNLVPDPDVLFDAVGNVTGVTGGEIDPALSAVAGQTVTVAPVPSDPAVLGGYAAAANQPRLFDMGPFRTLVPRNEAWKAETVLADRLGGTLSGSLNLTAEQSTDRAVSGLAPATLIVPASTAFSPFADTVRLNRYLSEAAPLRVRQTTTTLHGGGTVRGVIAGWRWDLTSAVDQKLISGTSEHGIDVTAANAAIAAGANPFGPLDPSLVANRLTDHVHLLTRTMGTKLVVSRAPFGLPAGEVLVTGTLEAERLTASSVTKGANPFDLKLGRTRAEGGAAIDVPLTSRKARVVPAIGDVSINGSVYARRVSGFGSLSDRTVGLAWSPFKDVQVQLQDKRSGTAPDMDKLASPIVHIANVAVFDRATGRTEIVDLTTGGNPSLAAQRKHVRSAALNVKPFADSDIRIGATYEATSIRNEVGDIYALPPELEYLFPDRFVRDANGRLTAETFEPTNFYRHEQRALNLTISANGAVGKKREAKAGAKEGGDGRAHYYAGAGPVIRFSDRLRLRPGVPALDLLKGGSITGGGIPRVTSYFYSGIGYLGNDLTIGGWYQGSARVRSSIPASDLSFSPLFKINIGAAISVHHFLPHEDWSHHLQVKVDVENATDAHVHVHDRNGNVPNRLQADYLDPIGRTVKLTLRKLW